MNPKPRRDLIVFILVEMVLIIALIGSGFWEGGVKWSWSRAYVIATLTHGSVSVSYWDFSHMSPEFMRANQAGLHLSGNAVVPDSNRPSRWMWTPNLYRRVGGPGPNIHALRMPVWILALVPLALLTLPMLPRRAKPAEPVTA